MENLSPYPVNVHAFNLPEHILFIWSKLFRDMPLQENITLSAWTCKWYKMEDKMNYWQLWGQWLARR